MNNVAFVLGDSGRIQTSVDDSLYFQRTFFATLLPSNHNVVKATQSKVQMFVSWVKLGLLMIGHHLFVHI